MFLYSQFAARFAAYRTPWAFLYDTLSVGLLDIAR